MTECIRGTPKCYFLIVFCKSHGWPWRQVVVQAATKPAFASPLTGTSLWVIRQRQQEFMQRHFIQMEEPTSQQQKKFIDGAGELLLAQAASVLLYLASPN